MKKSFIIAAIAFVMGLSAPVNAAEDVLIVNLQYVVSPVQIWSFSKKTE